MRKLRDLLAVSAILTVVGSVAWACSDSASPTRPPIPSINAAYGGPGGQRYCSNWSCAYDTCHNRPDWNGGSCCLAYTIDPSEAVSRPGYCSVPQVPGGGSSCGGKYWLDPGSTYPSTDDMWYCDVSQSCCGSGTGDPHFMFNPDDNHQNPNCWWRNRSLASAYLRSTLTATA